MKLNELSKCSENDTKVILFLFLLESNKISIKDFVKYTKLESEEFFESLNFLWAEDIISISIDKGEIYLFFNNKWFIINLSTMSKFEFQQFNKTLFMDSASLFDYVIQEVYIPKDLYDGSYMQIIDGEIIQKTSYQPSSKMEEQSLKRKATAILEYFYSELNSKYGVSLTKKARKIEDNYALEFVKSFHQYSIEELKEGISWFINDNFWKTVITSIYLLNKHYVKYIVKFNKTEEKTKDGLRII